MPDENDTEEDASVKLLRENRPNIIDALMHDPSKAFDEAIARGLLSREDYKELEGERSDPGKIRKCLDIVDGKGKEFAKIFLKILHDLRGSYPRLGPWIKDAPRREPTSVHEAERILQVLSDKDLLFFLKMEKSSLSEEVWDEFPSLCDAVRKAQLLPKCDLKDFDEVKRSKLKTLLNLIMEEGAKSSRPFCQILLHDQLMKVPMLKMMESLERDTTKNKLRIWGKAQDDLKEEFLKNFRTIKDYNALPGECTRLDDRFVEPIIVKRKPGIEAESPDPEMMKPCREYNLKKINEDRVPMEDLFEQNESSVQHVTKVVMFGSPGIGKSTLCKKLVVDWAEEAEKMKNKFDFVILLKCRNLNHISTETTLKKILLNEYPSLQEVVDYLMENASRVLLVLDALDEMKYPLDFDNVCKSPQEANKIGSIIAGLLQGTLLRHGTLLVTTRLVGLQWLYHVDCDPKSTCTVEIVGFSHEKTKEFFEKFYRNEDKAKQVLQHVSGNEVLSSLCFNPVFCWITATCIGRYFDSHEGSTRDPLPKTMTELFSLYLHLHLEHHGGKSITSSPDSLLRLCRLAFHGVKERKILFSEEDLKSEGITNIPPAFLSEVFLKTEVESVCHYEFFHLTVQEFFAALYFLLPECEKSVDEVFVKTTDKDDTRFKVVQQFLSGLFADKPRRTLGKHFKLSTKPKDKIHSWLQEHKHKDLNCFHCVFELQDVEFTKAMMEDVEFEDLTENMTSPLDCTVVVYALQTANKPMDSWNVKLGPMDRIQRMKILAPAFPLCESLRFDGQFIADEGLEILMKSLVSKPNRLKVFGLVGCKLSTNSGPILRDLKSIINLEELNLSWNPIGDEGLEELMEGLKSQTKLRILELSYCKLSTESGPVLRDLKNFINLEELVLRGNPIGDEGLEGLMEGLKSQTKLRNLWLMRCDLSTKSGPILRDLKNILNLKDLDLSWNPIGDEGLEGLMEGLKSQTKLRILRLSFCTLSTKSVPILMDLKNNMNLEVLDVGGNDRRLDRFLRHSPNDAK
uniref:NACHT, LRR and PYD domains-containing protein 12-like n=1 Tax=Myxine glutinosa TaxID=7769 RepID=UPI00358F5227